MKLKRRAGTGLTLLFTFCSCNGNVKYDQPASPIFAPHENQARSNGQRPRKIDYPDDGVELGQGWQSTLNRKSSTKCIDFARVQDAAQEKSLDLKEVADKSSLMQALNISAEARVQGIIGSANAKLSFASNTKIDEEQSTFAVLARVTNGTEYVAPPASGKIVLKYPYDELASKNQSAFFKQCGDSFVSNIDGGAELSAVLAFHVYQIDEKKALSTSIHGSGWGTFDADGSVAQTMEKYSNSKQFTIAYHEAGGSRDPIPTDQAGLVNVIHSLPMLAQSAPKYFTVTLTRYDTVSNWPRKHSDWLYTQYEEIASQYEEFASLHDSVERMIASPDDYILGHGVSVQTLQTIEGQLLAHLKSLTVTAQRCIESSGADCAVSTSDQVSDYEYRIQLPVRKDACPAYLALQNAQTDASQKLDALHKALSAGFGFGEAFRAIDKQKFADQFAAPQRAQYDQAVTTVQSLTSQLADGVRDAIATQWIEKPAKAVCDINVLSPDCIDEPTIQKYKQRIVVN